jgi:hypothetical protein
MLEHLRRRRYPWESMWNEAIELANPGRGPIDPTSEYEDKKRGQTAYSSKAVRALRVWANGLKGYLVSPSFPWFKLMLSDGELNENAEVRSWLEVATERVRLSFQRSNFYSAIDEYFRDGGCVGTATMFSNENVVTGKINYSVRHPREIFIAETAEEVVDTIFRDFLMPAREVVGKFGSGGLPESVLTTAKNTPYASIPVVHACLPSTDEAKAPMGKPILSAYILPADTWEMSVSGYSMVPATCWRTLKNSDEEYGRSPATEAICEISGINTVTKSLLQQAQLAGEPPLNAPDELRGKVRINPRGINYYSDPQRMVTPMNIVGDMRGGMDREARFEHAIDEHFNVDFFLMLNSAEKVMTATEIMEKQGEKAVVLGSQIGRLTVDVLDPLMDRAFEIEYRAGRIPPPPAILAQRGGRIDVDYLGPLSQIQKRHFKTQGITNAQQVLFPMAAAYPEVLYVIDPIKTAKTLVEAAGMPQDHIRTDEEIQSLIDQKRQQEAAQAQAELAQTMASAAGNARRTIEPNSAAEKVLQEVQS